jgi:hypothetical protein
MTPALRELKRHQIRTLFNLAIKWLNAGDRDSAFECLIKIQGMMAAFHDLDANLYAYAKLAETAFSSYAQTRTISPFMHTACVEARIQ